MSVKNLVQCPLITPVSSTATELLLGAVSAPYSLPPLDGGILVISDSPSKPSFVEFITYTHRIDNVLYGVSRGQEETAARAWSGVTYVYQALTADQYTSELASKEPVIPPGTTAQYWRGDKSFQDLATAIRAANLTGFSTATNAAVVSTDTLLAALGKLQAQVSARLLSTANAVSATKLQTARTISVAGDATGSLTFDGTANVSMDVTLQPSGVTAGTHTKLTVDSKGRVTGGTSLLVSDVPVLNQNTTGNAGSATKLATARSITLAGDVTGSASFDGSANVSISATVANDSHTHDTRYPVLSAERVLTGVAAGSWVTIAQVPSQGGRAYGEFIVYDTDSGKHNVVKIIASHTYGQSVVACVGGNRFGTRTIAHVRVLHGTVDRTYDGAKLQVYIENTCALRVRALMINQINGWSAWSEMTPVVEGTPADWVEDTTTRYDDITNTATGFSGSFSGSGALLTGLNAANLASGTIPDARLSGTYTGVNITGNAATATALQTARTINGVAFNGTANITVTAAANGGTSAACSGNAATATALQTARTINGVSFNGTANITVADATKLPLSGGTLTGTLSAPTFSATSTANGGFQGIDADTATVPSFTWSGDLDTGIYRPGADVIGFTAGGAERGRVNTTGFSGNGSQLTALNASNLGSGTVAVARGGTGATATTGTGNNVLSASPALTGTPTAPTAAAGTNTTQLATTAFVKVAVDAAPMLGVGQTWQNVTSSRAIGTTYTNTTGRSIQIFVTFDPMNAGSHFQIDGVDVLPSNDTSYYHVSCVIPAGATYRLVNAGTGIALKWVELR